ncbi:metal regulatory transcription factor [Trichophyton mentagrophytes]|nr:metal regulatory transcription factor [Trichophyton mentagrophytes]
MADGNHRASELVGPCYFLVTPENGNGDAHQAPQEAAISWQLLNRGGSVCYKGTAIGQIQTEHKFQGVPNIVALILRYLPLRSAVILPLRFGNTTIRGHYLVVAKSGNITGDPVLDNLPKRITLFLAGLFPRSLESSETAVAKIILSLLHRHLLTSEVFRILEVECYTRCAQNPGLHECDVAGCISKFPTRWRLNMHARSVHGPRVFECDVAGCTSKFPTPGQLDAHARSVHGPKVFECDVAGCTSKFSTLKRLNDHARSVHGPKVFECDVAGCTSKFSTLKRLKTHTRKVHRPQIFQV